MGTARETHGRDAASTVMSTDTVHETAAQHEKNSAEVTTVLGSKQQKSTNATFTTVSALEIPRRGTHKAEETSMCVENGTSHSSSSIL